MRAPTSPSFLNHLLLLLICLVAAIGCGSGIRISTQNDANSAANTESIKITGLSSPTLTCDSTVQLTATSTATNFVPSWSVQGAGTISADGIYSAPSCATKQTLVSVSATDLANGQVASITFQLVPAATSVVAEVVVIHLPAGSTLNCGTLLKVSASSNTTSNFVPVWSASGGGSIDQTGSYTAPVCPSAAVVSIVATDPHSSVAATASLQIVTPTSPSSEPINITGLSGGKLSCGQSVSLQAQSELQGFVPTWGVSGGGSITSAGVLTAPACPSQALITVTASDAAGMSHSSLPVQIVTPAPTAQQLITITGAGAGTVPCGQSVALTALSTTSPFNPIWSVQGGGSISQDGSYSAPSCPNQSKTIVTASDSATGSTATLPLSVIEPTPSLSAVSPQSFSPGVTIMATVSGSGFDSSSVVLLNGNPLPTVLLSQQTLAVHISPLPNAVSSSALTVANGSATMSPTYMVPVGISYDAAARFLQQASWGATPALIAHVQAIGFDGYLTEQFSSAEDSYTDADFLHVPENFWWAAAFHDQSQLRTKVGWAWYKLFNSPGSTVSGMLSSVPNITNRDAFASYSTLLADVSKNIEMGLYFNYCCFDYAQAVSGNHPDENFGRELLQQFTVGPFMLNQDGSYQLDNQGVPLQVSQQSDITSLARSMTGLAYTGNAFAGTDPEGLAPMISGDPSTHDTGVKVLLGQSIPGGMDAATELVYVTNQLANNPNTGVHLSKYLIHELVTSNPSPEYISRVAAVWTNDGLGHQGNIQAVVRALLLDPEARMADDASVPLLSSAGRFRDSINYETSLIRQFGASALPGIPLIGTAEATATLSHEGVFSAPSVFGYYSDYNTLADGSLAPEAQIYTSDAILQRANFATYVFGLPGAVTDGFPSVNWSHWEPLASGDGSALLDAWNHLCFHGQMSADLYNALKSNLQATPEADLLTRVQQTAYLLVMSPEYMVEN